MINDPKVISQRIKRAFYGDHYFPDSYGMYDLDNNTIPAIVAAKCIDVVFINMVIELGFKEFQSAFSQPNDSAPNYLYFPNAWDIEVGDTIVSVDQDDNVTDSFIVTNVHQNYMGVFSGHVEVAHKGDSSTNVNITDTTMLRLPDNRFVRYMHDFPEGETHEPEYDDEEDTKIKPSKNFPPTVSYRVIRVEHASTGGKPFSGTYRDISKASNVISTVGDPDDPSYAYNIHSLMWDNLVQYSCWTTSNIDSDRLVTLFERFMLFFSPVLSKFGCLSSTFNGRMGDRYIKYWGVRVLSRTTTFFFRTAYYYYDKYRVVGSISIEGPTIAK